MMVGPREESEKLLARSLSRHIGYTSGAYDLQRIFSTLDVFRNRTSAYKEEIVAFLASSAEQPDGVALTTDYLGDILSFALSMGLLEAVSARDAGLVRLAATELGRSILGARAVEDKRFYEFYSAQIVLRADADFIVPILLFFRDNPPEDLNHFFVGFQTELRQRRLEWLVQNFPERLLLERIADQLSWLSKRKGSPRDYDVDIPTLNTARHHATPRHGWIEQLGMFDKRNKSLTAFGGDVLRSLVSGGAYFWLAPSADVLDSLGISDKPAGAAEDTMDFAPEHTAPSMQELENLVEDLGNMMVKGYSAAKLVHASQASLQLPIEYVRYRSYSDNRLYQWEDVLTQLFQQKRGKLERYSARKGKIGFYRVVA